MADIIVQSPRRTSDAISGFSAAKIRGGGIIANSIRMPSRNQIRSRASYAGGSRHELAEHIIKKPTRETKRGNPKTG